MSCWMSLLLLAAAKDKLGDSRGEEFNLRGVA